MPDNPPPDQAASNSLGLDLDALKLKDDPEPAAPKPPPADGTSPSEDTPTSPTDAADTKTEGDDKDAAGKKEPKEKKKPYVNPDRVKTGGQRVRLFSNRGQLRAVLSGPLRRSLVKRSSRSGWRASASRTRRSSKGGWYAHSLHWRHGPTDKRVQDVQADEDEYKKMQEVERVKVAKAKKVQESVDKAREQNARRKMDKVCLHGFQRLFGFLTATPLVDPKPRVGLWEALAGMEQAQEGRRGD